MKTPARTRRNSILLALSLLGAFTAACASEEPVSGTWAQSDAQTPLPAAIDPMMRPLHIDTTWELDDTENITVHMDLEALGLTDSITLEGTYIADGAELELAFTGFAIEPESGNEAMPGEDGAQCIVLQGFAGTPVCFPPQVSAYTVEGDTLSITLEHVIAGDAGSTDFTLTRVP